MNSESKQFKPFARSEREEPGLVGYPDDQHAPLIVHPKGIWLRKQCPRELRKVSALAHDRSTEHIRIIESVASADAQYALLMHYYRVAGIIEKTSRRSPMTNGRLAMPATSNLS